jgi:hypothetical protein
MYTCNICDQKFSQLALMQVHKSQDHGLNAAVAAAAAAASIKQQKHSPNNHHNNHNHNSHHGNRSKSPPVYAMQLPKAPSTPPSSSSLLASSSLSLLASQLTGGSTPAPSPSLPPLPVVAGGNTDTTDKFSLACTFCSQTFKSRTDLDKHAKIHLNNSSQKCNICDEVRPYQFNSLFNGRMKLKMK